jgi:hypothetical protein
MRPFLLKTNNTTVKGGPKVKFIFYFIDAIHEALLFKTYEVRSAKDHGHTRRCIWMLICLTMLLKVAMVRNFKAMLGQTLKHSCRIL